MIIDVSFDAAVPAAIESPRVREVRAMFGIGDRAQDHTLHTTIIPKMTIDVPIGGRDDPKHAKVSDRVPAARAGVTLITGPSGSGKSTLLRLIAHACRARGLIVHTLNMADAGSDAHDAAASREDHDARERAIIDRIACDQPLAFAMGVLSQCGLGDAFLMQRSERELSDGQRFRFILAKLLGEALSPTNARRHAVVVIDEFAATLDRPLAKTLARNIRRCCDRAAISFILATTHEDLADALQPDAHLHKQLAGGVRIVTRARTKDDSDPLRKGDQRHSEQSEQHENVEAEHAEHDHEFIIEPGSLADHAALAAFHYRSHHPGAATSVLRLRHRDDDGESRPVGVLVRSLPAINCSLRDRATCGRYRHLDARERGIALNREVRCISRVIIDPRFRGRGLAVRLVQHALKHPEREGLLYTEALAVMGRISPFFQRAGMQRFEHQPCSRPAYERFEAAMNAVSPADSAASNDSSASDDSSDRDNSLLLREAKRFLRAASRCSSRALAAMTEAQIIEAARTRLHSQPVYFLYAHRQSSTTARSAL